MTVELVRQQLAKNWRKVLGVRTVFDTIPHALQAAQLPAVVLYPGEATYDTDTFGDDTALIVRTWRMTLYLYEAALGVEGQLELDSNAFIDAVWQQFLNKPQLTVDGDAEPQFAVFNARLLGDAGFQVGNYPIGEQKAYALIDFREQVSELAGLTYSGG